MVHVNATVTRDNPDNHRDYIYGGWANTIYHAHDVEFY